MASDTKDIKPFIRGLADFGIEYPAKTSERSMTWMERLHQICDFKEKLDNLETEAIDEEVRQQLSNRLHILEDSTRRESHLNESKVQLDKCEQRLLKVSDYVEFVKLQREIKETVKLSKPNKIEFTALLSEINLFSNMVRRYREQNLQLQEQTLQLQEQTLQLQNQNQQLQNQNQQLQNQNQQFRTQLQQYAAILEKNKLLPSQQ